MAFLIPLLISLAVSVVSILLTPMPKAAKPAAAQDAQYPTASAGTPIVVVFGTMKLKAPNVLYYSEKSTNQHDVKV